jgi:hypothetical protein
MEMKLKLLDRKAVEVFFGGTKPLNACWVLAVEPCRM